MNNYSTLKTVNISISELLDNLTPEEVSSGKIATTNKVAVKSILDDFIIKGKYHLFLTKDESDNYYIFIRYSHTSNITFNVLGREYKWVTNPGVNLIPVNEKQLEYGIDININTNNEDDINVDRRLNIKTTPSNCTITERSYIQNLFDDIVEKKYTIDKYCDDNAPKRYDLINYIAEQYDSNDYLEIGVNDGSCIRKIRIPNKDGVDPSPNSELGFGEPVPEINYQVTSDYFFDNYAYKKYDVIFIDGLHHAEQVDVDIQNSLKYLNDGGFILLHDCNPPEYEIQLVPRQSGIWNGDVWKSIVKLRCTDPSLEINVIDTDWGIGLITKGEQEIYTKASLEECLEWNYFDKNRDELLNIISVDEFYKMYKNELNKILI